jgi:nicotinamidase/pyrazinamidase
MTYALIAVDVQRDFLPGGVLGVPDSDRILIPLVQLTRNASLVVASRDWHPDNHFSFSDEPRYEDGSWPPHCVQKTRGAKIHPSINRYADFIISKGMKYDGPDDYSVFAGKTLRPVETLEEILQRTPIDTVVVGGLAFDYCVRYTALDACALGYHTVVPLDATAALSSEGADDTFIAFKRAGVEVQDHYVG